MTTIDYNYYLCRFGLPKPDHTNWIWVSKGLVQHKWRESGLASLRQGRRAIDVENCYDDVIIIIISNVSSFSQTMATIASKTTSPLRHIRTT